MKCPDCNIETNENPCPQCGRRLDSSQLDMHKNQKNEVLEPEIVDDNDTWNRQNNYHQQGQAGNSHRNFIFVNPQFNMNASCLPSFISLFLAILVFFQLGFLATLGFVFFLIIGKAISFYIMIKNLSKGKLIPPILLDCVVWALAYSFVVWLV